MKNIQDVQSWFEAIMKSCFGIILPSGWLGRPYDNQHVLDEYRISTNEIYFKFDEIREIRILSPKKVIVERDSNLRLNLSISEFEVIELKWFPYGEEDKKPSFQFFKEGKLYLVGYFI